MRRERPRLAVLAAVLLLGLTACGSSNSPAVSGTLTIFAATSLKAAFNDLAEQFAAANPGLTITPITFDGSTTLATQLTGGAEADVFASADDNNMKTVSDAGLVEGTPVHFVSNTLQIVVKPGNPLGIAGLADVVKPEVQLVLCDDKVPCGAAAQKAFAAAGLTASPVSKEQNVGAVLDKVKTGGEADAGLVYRTDIKAAAAGTVDGIDFPESAGAVNVYPIGQLKDAPNPAAAAAFIDYVTSSAGQAVLAGYGFAPPPAG
jgi:molybdate transport system substrate-binding protein